MDDDHLDDLSLAFIHMYFNLQTADVSVRAKAYIENETHHETILNYLNEIGLRFMVGDSTDTFKYVMPQFRFVCNRDYQLEIIKFKHNNVFLKKGAVVYATNLFVKNASNAIDYFLQYYPDLINSFGIKSKSEIDDKFYIWNGSEGIIFSKHYLDWMGMKICDGDDRNVTDEDYKYRLYLVGDDIAKKFIETKINKHESMVYKNYYKGTPLRKTNNELSVINDRKFATNNYDTVFDAFEKEFDNNINQIHFIQRDYIYDATNFNSELLEALQKNWISDTSIYKTINKFALNPIASSLHHKLIIDRYAANMYRKMIVNDNFILPLEKVLTTDYIFIPNNMYQIRHTLNAAYVPRLGLVILATHAFFGARKTLNFVPAEDLRIFVKSKIKISDDDVFYHIGGSYFLEETYFNVNKVPIFILVHIDDDLIVRHNLINTSRKLKDLKYNWVSNTILNLFVRKH
nr:p49 [Darna trima granulovirus]